MGDLPTTYVHDLVIHPRDDIAVIATHGRGMWAMDVQMLRNVIEIETSDDQAGIFDIAECMLPYSMEYYRRTVKKLNAPYYLKKAGKVDLKVTTSAGTIVFEKEADAKKGINHAEWDLLTTDEKLVEAGTYKLKISGEGFDVEEEFEVVEFNR